MGWLQRTHFFADIHSMAQSLRVIAASFLPSPAGGDAFGIVSLVWPPIFVEGINMAVVIQAGTEGDVKVAWVDEYGNAARVDGETSWKSSDESVASVAAQRPDTTRAHVKSLGPIGPVQIQATVDGDLGEGRQTITAILNVSVIAGQASGGEITADDDEDAAGGSPPRVDNTLPGSPPRVDNTLPGSPPRVDNALPGSPGAPSRPPRVDNALPGSPGAPSRPPRVDNTLPTTPGRVDNTLPPTPEPKARVLGQRRK